MLVLAIKDYRIPGKIKMTIKVLPNAGISGNSWMVSIWIYQ
jgi:hypothetical protein